MPVLRLPSLFTDHMVLQRDVPVPVWGWADPGAEISVALLTNRASTRCGKDGRFRLELPALQAGGPHTLVVSSAAGAELVLKDVLVGEVWLCSGQSNMDWSVSISGYSAAEIRRGGPERLRLFKTPNRPSSTPCEEVPGQWTSSAEQYLAPFSGVGYAFACELIRNLDVPVGLVQSAWGGTAAEWWTPIEALTADPELRPIVERMWAQGPIPEPGSPEHKAAIARWEEQAFHKDPGNKGEAKGWAKAKVEAGKWKEMELPQYWEATGLNIDGAVWFRKTIKIPEAWVGSDLMLSLGPIDDFDTTYVNGTRVGGIGKETPNAFQVPRCYDVPAKLVTSRSLTIAVRVFDHLGNGGIYGTGAQMLLHQSGEEGDAIRLDGTWQYRVELALEPKPWLEPPVTADAPSQPARLWNGMIQPLVPYAMRGAIWYQGESNADRAEQYRILMRTMINCWRDAFATELHFYQVQLAPFMQRREQPGESAWAELREAQEQLEKDLRHVDCAVIIDSGDVLDIHPRNKPLVGRRLARIALAKTYGQELEHSGPRLAAWEAGSGTARLRFSHCEGGLVAFNGPPVRGFAIAGKDKVFHWADATIDADCVILRSAKVAVPVAVRYAWSDHPDANLMNQDNLPARPFRTDTWPGVTTGKR